jgi:hypothetical protein
MDEPMAEDETPGPVASALALLRLMAGWAAAALGLLNLSMGIDTDPDSTDGPYLVFHVVLLITGLIVLTFGGMHRRPGRIAVLTGAFGAGGGFLVGLLLDGYPFPLSQGRHVAADLVFWGCVGLSVLLLRTRLQKAPAAGSDAGSGSGTGPAVGPVVQPAATSAAGPVAQPGPGPVAQPAATSAAEPVAQPAAEPVAQPAAEPVVGSETTPSAGPVVEPGAGPVVGRVTPPAGSATHAEQRAAAPRDESVGGLP